MLALYKMNEAEVVCAGESHEFHCLAHGDLILVGHGVEGVLAHCTAALDGDAQLNEALDDVHAHRQPRDQL